MPNKTKSKPACTTGPDGRPLTIADLPPRKEARWIAKRKAQVVAAVEGGLLSLEEACRRYELTREEFASWQRALHRYGTQGLKMVALQLGRARKMVDERKASRRKPPPTRKLA